MMSDYESERARERQREKDMQRAALIKTAKWITGGVALFFTVCMVSCSMTTVDLGHRGVEVRFGKVVSDSLPPDLYFLNPFTTDMRQLDVRVMKWEGKTESYTKDVQQATTMFTLNYNLNPDKAHIVLATVGDDWASKLIGQVVFEEIKREIGQHEAVNIVSKREDVSRKIKERIVSDLARRDIIVTGFNITNIDYTPEFEQAVEAKVIAVQNAITEQNRTVQKIELAKQQVETAKGNAEALVLNAKAEAESIKIRAQALEQNAKLVEWEAVQKWNGVLPQYTMGGAVPFINLTPGR